MIEYIPISSNLMSQAIDLASNGGISLMATEECSCESSCSPACQYRCENGGQTVATYNNTSSFNWRSLVAEDETIYISAEEWNDFAQIIERNAPYTYAGSCSIDEVNSGDLISASVFNELKNSIEAMNATGIVDKRSKIDLIKASDFLTLTEKMNSAPIVNISCCELGQKKTD